MTAFLADYGFYEIFLPFILVFAIVFGILQKTQILGRDKKRLNIGVALAVALTAVGSLQFSGILQGFVAKLGFALVILLGIALFLGFMGVPLHNKFTMAFAIIAFLVIVFAQFSSPAITSALASFLTNGIVIGIIILALILYLFVRSPKPAASTTQQPEQSTGPRLEEEARYREGTPEYEDLVRREGSRIQDLLNRRQQNQAPQESVLTPQQTAIARDLSQRSPQEQQAQLAHFLREQQQGFPGVSTEERAIREFAIRYLQGLRGRR